MAELATLGADKGHHVGDPMLKTGRAVPEHQNWSGRPDAIDPHARPYQDRVTNAVSPGREEDEPASAVSRTIDGILECLGIVRSAITSRRDRDGARIRRR